MNLCKASISSARNFYPREFIFRIFIQYAHANSILYTVFLRGFIYLVTFIHCEFSIETLHSLHVVLTGSRAGIYGRVERKLSVLFPAFVYPAVSMMYAKQPCNSLI